jgi:hypothetical protein
MRSQGDRYHVLNVIGGIVCVACIIATLIALAMPCNPSIEGQQIINSGRLLVWQMGR